MPIGPVEYMVVGFPGNKFTGAIAPASVKGVRQMHWFARAISIMPSSIGAS